MKRKGGEKAAAAAFGRASAGPGYIVGMAGSMQATAKDVHSGDHFAAFQ